MEGPGLGAAQVPGVFDTIEVRVHKMLRGLCLFGGARAQAQLVAACGRCVYVCSFAVQIANAEANSMRPDWEAVKDDFLERYVWCGVVWCGVVWCGVVWCGVVWCGVVWCGVVWCGVVWCGVVWCGVVWCGVV